jgi:hypothetical protein
MGHEKYSPDTNGKIKNLMEGQKHDIAKRKNYSKREQSDSEMEKFWNCCADDNRAADCSSRGNNKSLDFS